VRVSGQEAVLFRLGSDLVGEDPAVVQGLLLALTGDFLSSLDTPPPLAPQLRRRQGVSAWLLDPSTARRWERSIHTGDNY
jgi:hypothetical protein